MTMRKIDEITVEALKSIGFDEKTIKPTVYNIQNWLSTEKDIEIVVTPFWGIENKKKFNYRVRKRRSEFGPWFSEYNTREDAWHDAIKAALISCGLKNLELINNLNDSMINPVESNDESEYTIPPLRTRLTWEESDNIKKMYQTSKEIVAMESDNTMMYAMHTQIMCVLENIFGVNMFE